MNLSPFASITNNANMFSVDVGAIFSTVKLGSSTFICVNVFSLFCITKQFFVKPTPFPAISAIACTMPSPGLGTTRILSDIAAPIPVKITARIRAAMRTGKLSAAAPPSVYSAGIRAENTFRKLLSS